MSEEKTDTTKESHMVCHSPCKDCEHKGYLANKEICPSCGGTGCLDKKSCSPAGGLVCE